MGRRRLAGVALAAYLVSAVFGYGTTVSIAVSYCPATYTSSTTSLIRNATTTSITSSTPSSNPIVLAILKSSGGQPQYVAADGTLTNDSTLAVDFIINPTGQLMGAGGYISTDGNETSATFGVSPTVGPISTVFSLVSNDTLGQRDETASAKILVWRNRAFIGGEAIFCIFGSILEVAFGGEAPAGCIEVVLGAIPVSSLPSTSSTTTASQSSMTTGSGVFTNTITSTILVIPTTTVSFLSHTTEPSQLSSDVGHMSSSLFSPSSPSYGSFTTSPVVSSGAATSRVIQTTNMGSTLSPASSSSPSSNRPSSAPMSSTTPGYPAPTTTGTPNCYDRSPYDGTVNDDYLILCDTDLSGYDLERVAASNIAECIDQCNSYIPSSEGPCVAVAFDILAQANPCSLKYNISEVYKGADEFSQAAVLVNQPYSPEVVFADTSISSSTSGTEAFSTTPPPETTTTALMSSPSPISSISIEPPPVSSTTSAIPNTISLTSPGTSSQQHTSSLATSAAQSSPGVASSTTGRNTSPSPGTSSPTSAGTALSSTTSPGSAQQPSSTATSTGQQQSSSLSSSRPSSSYVASPQTPSTTSPVATSTTTVLQSTPRPASSSPTTSRSSTFAVTTVLSTISSSSLTTGIPTSTTTLPLSTTTTPSYCSASPTTTALCPTYSHQALNVNGDGSCYEVECSTALQGNILNGNSTTASSLKTCISYCTLYNVAIPYGCVGVNFLGSLAGSSPNCILMSGVSSTTSGSGIDSARLLYPGYPAISDPVYATTSTTATSVSPMSTASVSTQTTGAGTGTTTSTSKTSTSPLSCPAAPTASSCPGSSPYCYAYTNSGNTANFEVECQTQFTGSVGQPLLTFSFEDCVGWCQYANVLVANSCVGLTFRNGPTSQGGSNNCFRYSSLTCATRGNATFDSARLLYAGYPAMADYGAGFNCPS